MLKYKKVGKDRIAVFRNKRGKSGEGRFVEDYDEPNPCGKCCFKDKVCKDSEVCHDLDMTGFLGPNVEDVMSIWFVKDDKGEEDRKE